VNRPNPTGAVSNLADSRRKSFWIGLALLLALMILSSALRVFAQNNRKVKTSVQPVYPELAKKNNIQGTTRLEVTISADGSVKSVKVLGGSPVLAQAATDAVKKWKYEPAPNETSAVLSFDFK
jgi:TonB family protein